MLLIKLAEFRSTSELETAWFQGLSGGKSRFPFRLAPGPRSGSDTSPSVTVRGRVAGVGEGSILVSAPSSPPRPTEAIAAAKQSEPVSARTPALNCLFTI